MSVSHPTHHTDVSTSCNYRDVNRRDADTSLFVRLRSLWVLCFLPLPFCSQAHLGRSGSSFDTYPTRRGNTSNTDPRTLSTPVPLDRVEVAVHTTQDYPLTKIGEYNSYGPYDSNSQLQDKAIGLGNGSDLEHDVEIG